MFAGRQEVRLVANIFGESDALLTVSDRHETDVYPPRENCIAPASALIVWTTNTKNKCAREGCEVAVGRDGRYDRSAFAHGLPQITSTTRFFCPLPSPPPALSPAPFLKHPRDVHIVWQIR